MAEGPPISRKDEQFSERLRTGPTAREWLPKKESGQSLTRKKSLWILWCILYLEYSVVYQLLCFQHCHQLFYERCVFGSIRGKKFQIKKSCQIYAHNFTAFWQSVNHCPSFSADFSRSTCYLVKGKVLWESNDTRMTQKWQEKGNIMAFHHPVLKRLSMWRRKLCLQSEPCYFIQRRINGVTQCKYFQYNGA